MEEIEFNVTTPDGTIKMDYKLAKGGVYVSDTICRRFQGIPERK